MNIQTKFTSIFIAVGLLPTLLLSVIGYSRISSDLTTKTVDQISSVAEKQKENITGLIQSMQEETVRTASQQLDLEKAVGDYLEAGRSEDLLTINDFLRNRRLELPQVHSIYVTDTQGSVIATTLGSQEGKSLGADAVYVPDDKHSNIQLRQDPYDQIYKLFVTAPMVLDKKNVPKTILLFVYNLDDIVATVRDYSGLGDTGETVLVLHSKNGDYLSLLPLRFEQDAMLKTKLNDLGFTADSDIIRNNGFDYRGHQVIVATRHIDNTDWELATKVDSEEALAPLVNLRNTVIIVVVSAVGVIALLSLLITRPLTRPIVSLTEKARLIALGDLQQRITVKSKDEIGKLADSFNTMTSKLQDLYASLEQKVKDRTQALNEKVQELAEAKAKDDAILGSVGDGMVVTGSSGTILLINAIAADLLGLGLDSQQLIGQSISLCKFQDDAGNELLFENTPSQAAIHTGQKVVKEVKLIRKDGSTNSLSINAMPIFQAGRITGVIQLIRDITREKEVDRMKTEFISLASHQLKTPLSAIRWFTEMLISGDGGQLNKEQTEFAVNVSESTERMIELVNSLLNISRIESGRIIIEPKPTDVSQLVQGIVNDLKAKIDEKKQAFIISVHKDLPLINLDPHLIGQVYLNLLTNAIKYTPEGGEIAVFVSRKGNELVSQVSDSGYGIPIAQQKRVFQKFFRADNVAKVIADGTGLGLYLVKAIIESSGGRITFQSAEGKGTTFWFSLPMTGMVAKKGEVTLS